MSAHRRNFATLVSRVDVALTELGARPAPYMQPPAACPAELAICHEGAAFTLHAKCLHNIAGVFTTFVMFDELLRHHGNDTDALHAVASHLWCDARTTSADESTAHAG